MTIKNLTHEEVLSLLDAYLHALATVFDQSNYQDEDHNLLLHMIGNVNYIKAVWTHQVPANKLTWKIMTAITGSPKVLHSTHIHPLQYDSDQNINQNFQLLYSDLLLNNCAAIEDLKNHIKINHHIEFVSGLFAVTSIFISELIAPWSAWGVSFLMPLYSTLALPLIMVLFLSIGISIAARLHAATLREIYWTHNLLTDQNSMENYQQKTAKFFQPNPAKPFLDQIEQSFIKINPNLL